MKNNSISSAGVLNKIMKYCTYRDRCHKEVKEKLITFGISYDVADEIMIELIQDKFLNEERFTRSFIRGKFRIKKWGRIKIRHALKFKDIPDKLIDMCMNEIDESEYIKTFEYIFRKKRSELGTLNSASNVKKLTNYLMQKGYEPDLVWKKIKSVLK